MKTRQRNETKKKKKRPVFIAIGRNEKRVWRLYLLVLLDDEIFKKLLLAFLQNGMIPIDARLATNIKRCEHFYFN